MARLVQCLGWITGILSMLMCVQVAATFADDKMMPVEDRQQLTGCWSRVVFSPAKMKEMNAIGEPWSNSHQWFCFSEDGSFNMKTSKKTEVLTETGLRVTFKTLPTLNHFEILQPGVIRTSNSARKKDTIVWNSSILKRSLTIEDITMPPGSLLMTISHPETKRPIYYRFLTKVAKS